MKDKKITKHFILTDDFMKLVSGSEALWREFVEHASQKDISFLTSSIQNLLPLLQKKPGLRLNSQKFRIAGVVSNKEILDIVSDFGLVKDCVYLVSTIESNKVPAKKAQVNFLLFRQSGRPNNKDIVLCRNSKEIFS